ncbi:MAG: MarR family transcriptional regulator [Eubacteriaceae bacterium]|nr:MarR family transcriptional regulator [Eubacteriaceae bacterium]
MVQDINAGAILKQINDELTKRANNALKNDGLTLSQVGVLIELYKRDPEGISIKELSKSICVTQPTMTGLIDRMKEKGIIDCGSDQSDRRIKMVRLNKKGKECIGNAEQNMLDTERQLLDGLTEKERTQFKMLLGKVRDNIVK